MYKCTYVSINFSFHVGSGCRDPSAFAIGIAYTRNLFNIGLKLGMNMHLLDLGGGYPGTHNFLLILSTFISMFLRFSGHKTELAFETIADVINRALEIHFPDEHDVRIIAEPGRFYAAGCFTLCCTVVARTQVSAERITKNGCIFYTYVKVSIIEWLTIFHIQPRIKTRPVSCTT